VPIAAVPAGATAGWLARLAPYLGAFLGPFAGNAVQVVLPLLQRDYTLNVQLAAFSLSAYLVPFAAAQFVSGAIADHFGRRRVLVIGFAAFGISSLAVALAPSYGLFLAGRAGQGLANACTTPILMAVLGDTVEPRRLGRALGWFGAANTAGLFLAPLVSGTLAAISWRLTFALLAVVCVPLAALYFSRRTPISAAAPRAAPPESTIGVRSGRMHGMRQTVSEVLTPALAALCVGAFLGYLSLNGVGFVIALNAATTFHLQAAETGLLLSCFGLAVMLSSAPVGHAVDRFGSVSVSAAGAAIAAVVLGSLSFAPTPLTLGVLLLVGGVAVAALWAGLTKLAVQASPGRRATASSWFNGCKFVGYSLAPVVYTPIYTTFGARAAFTLAAGASALILIPLAFIARRGSTHAQAAA
jgi:MFS family permease